MSAKRPRLGVNHLTVVPTNFERSADTPTGGSGDGDTETESDGAE